TIQFMKNYELNPHLDFDRTVFSKRYTIRTYLMISFMLYSALLLAGNGYSQSINLKVSRAPFETVVHELHKQSGFDFIYNPSAISGASDVTLNLQNVELTEALNAVFRNQPFGLVINGRTVIVQPREGRRTVRQSRIVEGVVTDRNQVPLQGVTVSLKGTRVVTQTNERGRFSIQLEAGHSVLVFSMVGHESKEVTARVGETLSVVLFESMEVHDEDVISGRGRHVPRDLTGTTNYNSAEDMESNSYAGISSALRDKVPGMKVDTASGEPGDGSNSKIRGASYISGG